MKIEDMSRHQVLSVEQALEIIGIGRATFWRMRKRGDGPKTTKRGLGRNFGVTVGDLIDWLESQKG